MESIKIEAKASSILPGFCSLEFELILPKPEKQSNLHAYFALDRSGSMSGQRIVTAKAAVKTLINVLKEQKISVSLLAYDDKIEMKDTRELVNGYEQIETFVESINARGGTVFSEVFNTITKCVGKYDDPNNVIIFVTDGQDGSGRDNLKKSSNQLQELVNKKEFTTCIHAIGIGEGHDAKLLTDMIQFGTIPGTFQYVATPADIQKAVDNLQGVLEVCNVTGVLNIDGDKHFKINIENIDDPSITDLTKQKVRGIVHIREEDLGKKLSVNIDLGKSNGKISQEIIPVKSDVPISPTQFAEFVQSQVVSIIDLLKEGKITEDQRKTFSKLIEAIDTKLDLIIAEIRKMPSIKRKKFMPQCLELKDLTTQFYSALQKDLTAHGLENVALAKLNDVVYKGVLKRNLAKKLNKRYEANINLLEKIDNEVESIATKFNKEDLIKKYPCEEGKKLEDYGYCLLSCRNWVDAILDSDCICITFNVERSQAAIADPSQVVIKSVNKTQLTCESFMESAIFTKSHEEDEKAPSFDKAVPASSLVKGLPEEIITGIMPLYINEDHWKIARLKMKPLMGWTATLDVLGYAPGQIFAIPFLLFAKANENIENEYQRQICEQIRQTCLAIYREHKKGILADIIPKLEKYYNEPLIRTIDSIANNQVFLAHLYFAICEGDISEENIKVVKKIYPMIIEEEIRRKIYVDPTMNLPLFTLEMIGADWKKYIDNYTAKIEESLSLYSEIKLDRTENLSDVNGKINNLSPKSVFYKEQVEKMFANIGPVHIMNRLSLLFDIPVCDSFYKMGIDTNEKLVTLLIESILHHKNADRRQAIESKLYYTPFVQDSAVKYIKYIFDQTVTDQRKAKEELLLSAYRSNMAKTCATKFAITASLDEAARLLQAIRLYSSEFGKFVNYVETHEMNKPLEKAKMLGTCQYNDEYVLGTETNHWDIGHKRAFRIWRVNREKEGNLTGWLEAFPRSTGTIKLHEELWQRGIKSKEIRKFKE